MGIWEAGPDRILRARVLLTGRFAVVSGVVSRVVSRLTLPLLPARVAMYFNAWGWLDACVSKHVGVFVVLVLSLAFALLAVPFRSIPSWSLMVANLLLLLAHVPGMALPNPGVRWAIAVLLWIAKWSPGDQLRPPPVLGVTTFPDAHGRVVLKGPGCAGRWSLGEQPCSKSGYQKPTLPTLKPSGCRSWSSGNQAAG